MDAPPPAPTPDWLCNSSFTTDLSVIETAIRDEPPLFGEEQPEEDSDDQVKPHSQVYASYELVEEGEGEKISDSLRERKRGKKKTKSTSKPLPKDYFFDTVGDPDNLAYGSLYRKNIPRYKPYTPAQLIHFQGLHSSTLLDNERDGDVGGLKNPPRYFSPIHAALERHKDLKRLLLHPVDAHLDPDILPCSDFIPLSSTESHLVRESWEDEVLRKTRQFNKLTRERPHDDKVWLDFAQFQDRVSSMQPQKGARLQTLEKKISILEKATELNPDNEELLLCLLNAHRSRDSTDVLIGRWEKVLVSHPSSCKLWKEYLLIVQADFSKFKVSHVRKMYPHAIKALSSSSSKQLRQVYRHTNSSSQDPSVTQLELDLVDIFLGLCRFEWQAGHRELSTALFQAEIEFSVFCPPLSLTEHSKLRLFEHFWQSDGLRLGEEGALGWSTWLEKEEENRQRVMKEESAQDDEGGGWTGWSEPLSKRRKTDEDPEILSDDNLATELFEEGFESVNTKHEDNTEALLKQLGIEVDAGASSEVKDNSTWTKWSVEESLRDSNQWMPLRNQNGDMSSQNDGPPDEDADNQVLREMLFEDVSEYLFSLSSEQARISLVSQFVDFFGGEVSYGICTNSSRWTEKILNLEVLPDFIAKKLRSTDGLMETENRSNGNSLEYLLDSLGEGPKRADMMKFLRNAILLCLTAFPRNYMLEEAALIAEEFTAMKMDSSTPCRALAKSLLRSDRQDVLLCGVYARREAAHGNIDHARRVFDMALSSVEGLPPDLSSSSSLLFFWYAEAELANNSEKTHESHPRALHILSCLGNGGKYSPFKCKPSRLELLRAHQGFKERMKTVKSACLCGLIDDQSMALTCCFALFEELTSGWFAGVKILDEAFIMVLPDRRSHSNHLEFLFNFYIKMLLRNHSSASLSKVWESILKGLQLYPSSGELFNVLLEISHLHTTPNKLRLIFDKYFHKKPSVMVCLFAVLFEMRRGGSHHRIHGLFERALADESLRNSVILWRFYIAYETGIANNLSAARRVFFRAINACPWSKKIWLDGFLKLSSILTLKELSDLQGVMRDKELNVRTEIYEILLEEDLAL